MLTDTDKSSCIAMPRKLSEAEVKTFLASVDTVLTKRPGLITLECGELDQVVSSHINLLWQAYLACTESKIGIRLRNASTGLVRILRALDLYDFFADGQGTARINTAGLCPEEVTARPDKFADAFGATPEAADDAMTRFLVFLEDLGLPEIVRFELKTVFYEVARNIVDHSGLDDGGKIAFAVKTNPVKIEMVFEDSGVAFDLSSEKQVIDFRSAAQKGQKRGFGIAMIHRLTDDVAYARTPRDTNVLTLTRNWSVEQ